MRTSACGWRCARSPSSVSVGSPATPPRAPRSPRSGPAASGAGTHCSTRHGPFRLEAPTLAPPRSSVSPSRRVGSKVGVLTTALTGAARRGTIREVTVVGAAGAGAAGSELRAVMYQVMALFPNRGSPAASRPPPAALRPSALPAPSTAADADRALEREHVDRALQGDARAFRE